MDKVGQQTPVFMSFDSHFGREVVGFKNERSEPCIHWYKFMHAGMIFRLALESGMVEALESLKTDALRKIVFPKVRS